MLSVSKTYRFDQNHSRHSYLTAVNRYHSFKWHHCSTNL